MSKKGGGAGDGKITPKNPSLRMRPRGGFRGGTGWYRNRCFWRFREMQDLRMVVAFHKKWPEENWFCQNRPYCGRTKPRVRKQTMNLK